MTRNLACLEKLEQLAAACPDPFSDQVLEELAALREALAEDEGKAEEINRRNAEAAYRAMKVKGELEDALEESRRAHARARAAVRAKDEFLRNLTHEFRTPMTSILGYADLLLDPMISTSDRHAYVRIIRRNGERLIEMIGDILEYSKLESGTLELDLARGSPAEILSRAIQDLRARAAEKNLALILRYEGLIPASIETDPNRLRILIHKVVENAIKFTREGSVTIEVRLEHGRDVAIPHLVFRVRDTGIGISKEMQDDIFLAFQQGDGSDTRRHGGAGLGLALARRIAHLLGGSIDVESEPGKGSTFTFSVATGDLDGIALVEQSGSTKLVASRDGGGSVAEARRTFSRVLLAEDGTDNQKLIELLLRKAGIAVDIASDGAAAVRMAEEAVRRQQPFRLILMDMQMPEMDGYAATNRLRQDGYEGPIVALTAAAMAGDRERCLRAGCDDYLTKPIDRVRLLSLLESYLRPDLPPGRLPPSAARAARVPAPN